MAAALAAWGEHPTMRLQCRCRRVTPCPRLDWFTHAPAGSYRSKPARDRASREENLVQGLSGYLQAMQSVGGSRWAVTVPEPCPRFGVQTSQDQRFVAAGRRVTRRLIPSFLSAQARPFSSFVGGGKRVAASAHRRGNPGGCVHGAAGPGAVGADDDIRSSRSSGR